MVTFVGAIVSEVGWLTTSTFEQALEPTNIAHILAEPAAIGLTIPVLLTVATRVLVELQLDCALTFAVVPSVKVTVGVNC